MQQSAIHAIDYDAQGTRIACRGTVYKMKKGKVLGMGRIYWKKKYAYCDERMLLIWKSDKPASLSTRDQEVQAPRAGFIIADCTFVESAERRYAFTIFDTVTQQSVTLALQDARSYEVWHSMFSRLSTRAKISEDRVAAQEAVAIQKLVEKRKFELQSRDDNLINEFFRKRDISSNPINPSIPTSQMQTLVFALDHNCSSIATRLACREIRTDPHRGSITKAEFLIWWSAYCSEIRGVAASGLVPSGIGSRVGNNRESIASATMVGSTHGQGDSNASPLVAVDSSCLHFASFLDSELIACRATRQELLSLQLPSQSKRTEPLVHADVGSNDTWNDVYQRLVGAASKKLLFAPLATTAYPGVVPTASTQPANDATNETGVSAGETSRAEQYYTLHIATPDESITALRSLAALQGEFMASAIEGARLIIDEYLLPLGEKTPGVVSFSTGSELKPVRDVLHSPLLEDSHEVALAATSEPSEEIFGYGGLLYRIAAVAAEEQDDRPSPQREAFVAGADDLFHKLTGNEFRHQKFLQEAINATYYDFNVSALQQARSEGIEVAADELMLASGAKPGHGPTAKVSVATSSLVPPPLENLVYSSSFINSLAAAEMFNRPRTLLSTVIDYAGYRITVLCPTSIDETSTLVHGFTQAADSSSAVPPDAVFINKHPQSIPTMLAKLASKLYLALENRAVLIMPPDSAPDAQLRMAEVEVLSKDLQVHNLQQTIQGADTGLYMMNVRSIFPSDLPRSETNDLLTRTLRPEFVRHWAATAGMSGMMAESPEETALCSDPLGSVSQDTMMANGTEDQYSGNMGAYWEEFASPAVHRHLAACNQLYTGVLPLLASRLDELTVIPVDSFTLSRCFHSHGASMRNIGVVYSLVRCQFARGLLLTEAVARCCKVLLNKTLRSVARRNKAISILAELRHKSHRKDFIDLNKAALASRRAIVLELFNVVLGSGNASKSFWQTVLPDILFQKFGINVDFQVDKAQLCHLPQLCLAMQYQTGTLLADKFDYPLSAVDESPVQDDDILSCLLPAVKLPASMPGQVGQLLCQNRAEIFLGCSLNPEAATLLDLQLELHQIMLNDSTLPKHTALMSDTIYKIALAHWAEGSYPVVIEILSVARNSRPLVTPVSARMLTLLMSAQLMVGDTVSAMASFEEASTVYMHTLGAAHPIMCLHMTALADAYHATSHHTQALVMMTLAHDLARRLLGPSHLLTASYGAKIAVLQLTIEYPDANEQALAADSSRHYLYDSLKTIESIHLRGGNVEDDLADALYALSECPGDDNLEAIANAQRAVTLYMTPTNGTAYLPPCQPIAAVSAIFTLAEDAIRRRDIETATNLLEQARLAIRARPSDYEYIGTTLALIGCKVLNALCCTLALQTRSLLDTIASEVADGRHGDATGVAWENACRAVTKVLWEGTGIKAYFQTLVDGVIQSEIEAGGGVVENKSDRAEDDNKRRSAGGVAKGSGMPNRALEIAVVIRLVEYHRKVFSN